MRERRAHQRAVAITLAAALSLGAASGARQHTRHSRSAESDPTPAPAAPGHVTDIRFWSQHDSTRVAIELDSGYKLKSDRIENPDRIFFDIVGVKPSGAKGLQTIVVGDTLVRQIRVAETQPGTTRIVLDLASSADFDVSQLTSPERLIIELRPRGSARNETGPGKAAKTFRPPNPAPSAPLSAAKIEAAPPRIATRIETPVMPAARMPAPSAAIAKPSRDADAELPLETREETSVRPALERAPSAGVAALPAKRTATGEASLTRVLGLKLGRVVIDAGHGGQDNGTSGPTGLLEKDLVLDVALRLASLVETRLGSEVILTRSDDTYVPLEQRTQIANNNKADLFISIHANSSPARSTSGVETYYLNFTTSKMALEVAARENASSERSIYDLKDLLQKIALKDKVEESKEFAARVQTSLAVFSLKNNANSQNRGVKKAPFVVLIGASMPSILAEIGFVTNTRDELLLKKPEHRQKLAEALFRGISQYASGLSHFQVAQRKPVEE